MKRRDFAGALGGATLMAMAGKAAGPNIDEWLDCNVTLGQWPFRKTAFQTPKSLAEKLQKLGVTQAWTASFDAIFQNDLQTDNLQLAQACRDNSIKNLLPVATINPALPDWQADLIFCEKQLSMSIVRLYPNYHNYTLEHACFEELFDFASNRKLAIQLVVQMEDDRTQPLRMQAPPVDLRPLAKHMLRSSTARVMILNATRSQLEPVIQSERVLFDIAKIEGAGVLEQMLETVNHERIVFGSHSPLFYWEAARLKLQESELLDRQLDAIIQGNAKRWANQ